MLSKIPWYSIGRFALILLCLVVILALVVMVLPIYLDISAFRGPIEESLSGGFGAPVSLGEIRLNPSLRPSLRVSQVAIGAPTGTDSPPLAEVDRLEVKLSLLALARGRLRLKRLVVSGAILHVHRLEGGGDNWSAWSEPAIELEELAGIEIENTTVLLEDHQTIQATLDIDRLTCDIGKDRPLDLHLRGSLEELPLEISAAGPTLAVPLSQASDFPLSIAMSLGDLQLNLDGSASREPGGTRLRSEFSASSENLDFLRRLRQAQIPWVGGFELRGVLSNRDAALAIQGLDGSLGDTRAFGDLAFDFPAERPRVTGRLSLGRLDLGPWLAPTAGKTRGGHEPLPLALLNVVDAHLEVSVQEIAGLETPIEEVAAKVDLEEGLLRLPITLEADGIPLSTMLEIDAAEEVPRVVFQTRIEDLSLQQVRDLVKIPPRFDGRVERLEIEAKTFGTTRNALAANLHLIATGQQAAFEIADDDGESPVAVFFDEFRFAQQPDAPLMVTAQGNLLQEDFTIDLETSSFGNLLADDVWPVRLRLATAGTTLTVDGTFGQVIGGLNFDLGFSLAGDRVDNLETWLGLSSSIDLPFAIEGRLTSLAKARRLRLDDARLGRTHLRGEIAWNPEVPEEPFAADLRALTLDLRELQEPSSAVADLDTQDDVLGIDIPILPNKTRLNDAEIHLVVDRLMRDTVDLTEIEVDLRMQDGRLESSPFSFSYGAQRFDGQIALDLRQEKPEFALEIHGDGKRLGDVLHQEGLVDDLTIQASDFDLRLDASGATIRELVRSADLKAQLVDVRWQIQPLHRAEPFDIHLERVDIEGPQGKPIELTAQGVLDREPLDLALVLRVPAGTEPPTQDSFPFELGLGLAATQFALQGRAHLPIAHHDFDMQLHVEGSSLANLSTLVADDLPDVGPYRLQGQLAIDRLGFALRDLELAIGESDLHGEISYRRVEDRPTFVADLTSRLLRTQDLFDIDAKVDGSEDVTADTPVAGSSVGPKLTLEALNGFDASVDLIANQILTVSGSIDKLVIDADLDRGNLDLEIRRPQESGEDVGLTARIRPVDRGIDAAVRAAWDRQPYGLVADLLNPAAAGGAWTVDLDLESRGGSLQEIAANLSGHLYLADYPVDFDATLFDLWGGGLLNSLLPIFQLGEESRVNCTVAKFEVDNGILTPSPLFLDSTRSRIAGRGTIDLPANQIDLKLSPRPKRRNLINLSMPVKVRGPLLHPDVQISKPGLALTFFRLSLWVYTVWRDIARRPLPADGSDICVDPFVTSPPKQ